MLEGKDADDPEHAHEEEGVRIKPVTVGESSQVQSYCAKPAFEFRILTIPVSQSLS